VRIGINRIFALVFAAVLFAPLLQMATRLVPEPAVEERRKQGSIDAPLGRLAAMDTRLSVDFDGWFDDHFGFRSVLIRLKNEIDYQVFATSKKIIIGRQGWLFDKEFFDGVAADAGGTALDRQVLDRQVLVQQVLEALRGLRNCLAKRGITLVFVLSPTKSSVYPQFLPAKPPFDPPPRLARRLAGALDHEPGLVFIDAEQILLQHPNEILFYKTDVHMNLKASSYVYRAMVAEIARAIGKQIPPLAPESWSVMPEHGDEERILAKFLSVDDIFYATPSILTANKNDELDSFEMSVGNAGLALYPQLPLYEFIYENKRPSATLLPPTMLFGTSFSDGIFSLKYNEVFAKVYRARSNYIGLIGPIMRHLPDDVRLFILESPEVWLTRIANGCD
jgi:hypothetical protein